jgi:hypothetical protein
MDSGGYLLELSRPTSEVLDTLRKRRIGRQRKEKLMNFNTDCVAFGQPVEVIGKYVGVIL